jgi:hypothetical protein
VTTSQTHRFARHHVGVHADTKGPSVPIIYAHLGRDGRRGDDQLRHHRDVMPNPTIEAVQAGTMLSRTGSIVSPSAPSTFTDVDSV